MKSRIDIDHLDEAELVDLNRRVVERLRFIRQARAHQRMLDFSVGDRVSFQPPDRGRLFGVLARYNRKTVTVITDQGERWNAAPASTPRLNSAGALELLSEPHRGR